MYARMVIVAQFCFYLCFVCSLGGHFFVLVPGHNGFVAHDSNFISQTRLDTNLTHVQVGKR